jgi:intein-encoded DNA endonuclease-like protein
MAMQAQGKSGGVDLNKISKDDMLIWLEQFDGFELVNKSKDIIEVYLGNSNISSKEKKKARKQSEN